MYDIKVKSPEPTASLLAGGLRAWDPPQHEEEVGQGPHGIRMLGRIVGARSAEQSVISLLTLTSYVLNERGTGLMDRPLL